MKTNKTFFGLVLSVLIFLSMNIIAQDIVDVPTEINGEPLGAINKFIQGDTTATGERNNPDRIYRLKRGAIYFINGPLTSVGYHLRLVGEEDPDPANPTAPAVIAPGIRPDGSSAGLLMTIKGDATIKNIYFKGTSPTQVAVGRALSVLKDSVRIEIDNCHFDWVKWITIQVKATDTKIFITNCYFRNIQHPAGPYNGRGLNLHNNNADSVVMVNNTFYNINSFAFQGRSSIIKYFQFEHNTLVNTIKWPLQWSWPTNAIISNNIFYNAHSYGEAPSDLPGQDYDGQLFGIINVDTVTTDMGVNEAERVVTVNNNCWYYSQEVQDYIAAFDSVSIEPWMNERTSYMFNEAADYPGFVEENTLNEDPGFNDAMTGAALMTDWMSLKRSTGTTGYQWGPKGENDDIFGMIWPLPEDLSYATSSTLYSAADGGFPVGDLNWFPDKKAEWEDWLTDVESDNVINTVPKEYSLNQNYPNPFNPTTVISFNLPEKSMVTLTVFNILGEEVATVFSGVKNAGAHKVNFNATNLPSGVYIYKLSAGNYTASKKMMLLK